MSLINFIILIASALLFHEGITVANIIGLIFISVGIAVASSKNGGLLCSSP
jgi:drug/metabolite transporter (DMT)-like permease